MFKLTTLRSSILLALLSATTAGGALAENSSHSYSIVDTNQSTCYSETGVMQQCPTLGDATYGQDSQYQGVKASYTDNNDATITDNNTDLMWTKSTDTNGDGRITAADKMTYDEAHEYAQSLTLAGYSDWRVPSIKELYSLMMFDGQDPSGVNGYKGDITLVPFIDSRTFDYNAGDTQSGERLIDGQYMSSTKYVSTTMHSKGETIFGVNFTDGRIKGYENHNPHGAGGKTFYIQLVRGNTAYGQNDFVDNKDGTVTDNATGLIWQQGDSGLGMNFAAALNYCETLDLAGGDDWRLPNIKELQSIVDYSRSPDTTGSAAIAPLFYTSTISNEAGDKDFANFWSSTTHASSNSRYNGRAGAYIAFGRSLGNMDGWVDVHGAGSQRSDPKTGDASRYANGHGPQGDAIRINNYVRCVSGGDIVKVENPEQESRQGDTFTLTGNEKGINDMPGKRATQKESKSQQRAMGNPISMMDRNGDNKLSRDEVRGPLLDDFSRIDRNSDGYISQDELPKRPPNR